MRQDLSARANWPPGGTPRSLNTTGFADGKTSTFKKKPSKVPNPRPKEGNTTRNMLRHLIAAASAGVTLASHNVYIVGDYYRWVNYRPGKYNFTLGFTDHQDDNETVDMPVTMETVTVSLVQNGVADGCVDTEGWTMDGCVDTEGWTNGYSKTCIDFVNQGFCKDGSPTPGNSFLMGSNFNNPEKNCCTCGKGIGDSVVNMTMQRRVNNTAQRLITLTYPALSNGTFYVLRVMGTNPDNGKTLASLNETLRAWNCSDVTPLSSDPPTCGFVPPPATTAPPWINIDVNAPISYKGVSMKRWKAAVIALSVLIILCCGITFVCVKVYKRCNVPAKIYANTWEGRRQRNHDTMMDDLTRTEAGRSAKGANRYQQLSARARPHTLAHICTGPLSPPSSSPPPSVQITTANRIL
eukprot:g14251.t1